LKIAKHENRTVSLVKVFQISQQPQKFRKKQTYQQFLFVNYYYSAVELARAQFCFKYYCGSSYILLVFTSSERVQKLSCCKSVAHSQLLIWDIITG